LCRHTLPHAINAFVIKQYLFGNKQFIEFEDTKGVIRIRISKIPKGGNQNPYIEEEQTTQWSKEKLQKDKQRSTKHTHKTKDRATLTSLKTFFTHKLHGNIIPHFTFFNVGVFHSL
jgi:hypothetical protein